jgi:hypothetical protein
VLAAGPIEERFAHEAPVDDGRGLRSRGRNVENHRYAIRVSFGLLGG